MLRESSGAGAIVNAEADVLGSGCVARWCDGAHVVHAYHVHWSELYSSYRSELWGNDLALYPLAGFTGGDPLPDVFVPCRPVVFPIASSSCDPPREVSMGVVTGVLM